MDIINRVDEVVEYYEKVRSSYEDIAQQLKDWMERLIIRNSEYTLSLSYRIKEPDSVREKLIRNSAYRVHTTEEEIIANIQDIIGIKIECKFTEDETYVYHLMESLLPLTDDQIYFYHADFPKMRFKMNERQPVKQKNGFDIYKIDARFEDKESEKDLRVNFEVQIKSMINNFWGEIEHKVIYKSQSYFMAEQEVLETLVAIRENLSLVDHQLHELYKRYKRDDSAKLHYRKENIQNILSKLIHDTVARKMQNDFGFVVQFKDTCDAIVDYLFIVNNATQMEEYGRVMTDVFYIAGNMAKEELNFREPLRIDREIKTGDAFIDTMALTIQKLMNVDFNWHLFFMILFEIERGSNDDDLETFLRYLKGRLTVNADLQRIKEVFPAELADKIKKDLINEMAYVFRRQADIKMLHLDGMKVLITALKKTVEDIIKDKPDWNKEKSIYLLYLNNSIHME